MAFIGLRHPTGASLPYTSAELAALTTHCTARKDDASKIEHPIQKSAAALLLSDQIGHQFDGLVTGASEKGARARIFTAPPKANSLAAWPGCVCGPPTTTAGTGRQFDR